MFLVDTLTYFLLWWRRWFSSVQTRYSRGTGLYFLVINRCRIIISNESSNGGQFSQEVLMTLCSLLASWSCPSVYCETFACSFCFILLGGLFHLTLFHNGVTGSWPMRCVWTKCFHPPGEGVVWNVMFSARSFQKDISIQDEYDSVPNWHSTTGK